MEHFTIRPASGNDVACLLGLIKELAEYERLLPMVNATEEGLAKHLFGPAPVAEAVLGFWESEPIAYAVFHPTFSTFQGQPGLYLEDLFIKSSHRGKGIGLAIMRHVARLAKARGYGRMAWSVLEWNQPAIQFYLNLGAQPGSGWNPYVLTGAALENLATE